MYYLVWKQLSVTYVVFSTNYKIFNILLQDKNGKSHTLRCSFCGENYKTELHIFYECYKTQWL